MPEKAKAVRWDMDGDLWRQEGDSFVLESLDGTPCPAFLTDLDWLADRVRALA